MLNTHTFSLSPSGVLNVLQSRICIKLAEKETGNKQHFGIQDLVYTHVCACIYENTALCFYIIYIIKKTEHITNESSCSQLDIYVILLGKLQGDVVHTFPLNGTTLTWRLLDLRPLAARSTHLTIW